MFYYNINIVKIFMKNVIILLLAVRICEDSDKRGSDKRGSIDRYKFYKYLFTEHGEISSEFREKLFC